MLWVMGTMSAAHLYRTLTDFGGYHLDFSGPLMILVQKLSFVAFAVHDGQYVRVRWLSVMYCRSPLR